MDTNQTIFQLLVLRSILSSFWLLLSKRRAGRPGCGYLLTDLFIIRKWHGPIMLARRLQPNLHIANAFLRELTKHCQSMKNSVIKMSRSGNG